MAGPNGPHARAPPLTLEEALAIVLSYFDEEHILPQTRLELEELLCG